MTTPLQPLSLGELLDRTFHLYRRHFVVFVGIMALPQLVVLALQLAQPNTAFGPDRAPREALAGFGWLLLWLAVFLPVSIVAGTAGQGATIVAVSELHLGRPITIAGAYRSIIGRLLQLCVIGLVVGIAIGIGFLVLIVPGVYLALTWALVVPVAVIEREPFWQAVERSRFLTDGARVQILVTFFLYFVLILIAQSLWEIPAFMAGVAAARAGVPGEVPAWVPVLASVGTFVTQSIVGPLMTIMLSLIYYDQRVRKEGFDLDHMLAQLPAPPAGAPAEA